MRGKWGPKLVAIKALAGRVPAAEIAATLGTTVNNLHKICHRNGISLPRPVTYRRHDSETHKVVVTKNHLKNARTKEEIRHLLRQAWGQPDWYELNQFVRACEPWVY